MEKEIITKGCLSEEQLIEVVRYLPGFICAKNSESQFISLSRTAVKLAGFNSIDEGIGLRDENIKCKAAEFADFFRLQDKKLLLASETQHHYLETHLYANNEFHTILASKTRISTIKGEKIIFFHGVDLSSSVWGVFGKFLLKSALTLPTEYQYKKSISFSLVEKFSIDKTVLSVRESECLFFLVRGYTAKMIADRLLISKRTVGTHINNIKFKLNCNSKAELIDKAIDLGLTGFVPKRLLTEKLCNEFR